MRTALVAVKKKNKSTVWTLGAGGESTVPNPLDTQYKIEEIPQTVSTEPFPRRESIATTTRLAGNVLWLMAVKGECFSHKPRATGCTDQ